MSGVKCIYVREWKPTQFPSQTLIPYSYQPPIDRFALHTLTISTLFSTKHHRNITTTSPLSRALRTFITQTHTHTRNTYVDLVNINLRAPCLHFRNLSNNITSQSRTRLHCARFISKVLDQRVIREKKTLRRPLLFSLKLSRIIINFFKYISTWINIILQRAVSSCVSIIIWIGDTTTRYVSYC